MFKYVFSLFNQTIKLTIKNFFYCSLILILLGAIVSCTKKKTLNNSIKLALRENVQKIDPIYSGDFYTNTEVSRVYEGLLQYHYLKRPYQLEPALAAAMPSVSVDKLTYTFKIKEGVFFQDDPCFELTKGKGREVVASDFLYSFERLLNPQNNSPGAWVLSGKVKNIKALNDHTLQIQLVKPNTVFLHYLALPYLFVVPKEAVQYYGDDFSHHPVGTGPFILEKFSSHKILWKKNPNYRLEKYPATGGVGDNAKGLLKDANQKLPFVDYIEEEVTIEDQTAWLSFIRGEHDILTKIPKDNIVSVLDSKANVKKEFQEKNIQVLIDTQLGFNYHAFNMEDPVVGGEKNRFLREAMSLAYDEAPTIEKFYLGLALKSESMIPPGLPGYNQGLKNPNRIYNLVKAREILAKAGYTAGRGLPELTYDSLGETSYRQLAEYFIRSMEALGLKVHANFLTWPELIERIRTKKNQIFGISWIYDYPDAENGLQLLYSKNVSPGPNESNYKNPNYDKMYEQVLQMNDGPRRWDLMAKLTKIFIEDVPWIVTVHRMETRLVHPWVTNYKINQFEYNHEKYLRVNDSMKKEFLK